MDNISIEGTPKTPTVSFNYEEGILRLKGRSIPENSLDFFQPLIDWLESYKESPKSSTVCNIELEYFNTSSSKYLLEIFKKLAELSQLNHEVTVNWYYDEEDEDMYEVGQDYQVIVKVPFKLIPVSE